MPPPACPRPGRSREGADPQSEARRIIAPSHDQGLLVIEMHLRRKQPHLLGLRWRRIGGPMPVEKDQDIEILEILERPTRGRACRPCAEVPSDAIAWCRSRARVAQCAPVVAVGAWPNARRTWSATCFRSCRCAMDFQPAASSNRLGTPRTTVSAFHSWGKTACPGVHYSARSAATLFVRVARMAGIQLATAAARQSAKVVTA